MKNNQKVDSKKLFGDNKVLTIEHNENRYILRITKDNKLILTK